MQLVGDGYEIQFSSSKEKARVSLEELSSSVAEFLELYGEEPIVGERFRALIGDGDGDGETRLARLLEASGHGSDALGFFAAVLEQLERASCAARPEVAVDGVVLPDELLLRVLELLIPGDTVIDVKSIRRFELLTNTKVPNGDREALRKVLELYPVRLSSHVVRQMRLSPEVAYQYLPFVDELDREGLVHTWVGQFHRGVIEQMYRNRVIFILNMFCPVYCRFCFRKHKECRNQRSPTQKDVSLGVAYIRSCPEVKEVVLTGGDPFMNRPTLTWAIDGLRDVPHVETLRVATRSVAYHPALFTARDGFWLNYLKRKQLELAQKGKHLELATHFIHPDEVSVASLEVIAELVSSGIPVYVQTPFLGGCNDSGEVLTELFRRLRAVGAETHYVYIPCSPLQGNRRYRSPISDGIDAMRRLHARLSDRAVPRMCTATAIGKIDWGSSGWAVEVDETDPRYLWIRTPYTKEFFESFAPILNLSQVTRENSEGTLDARFMVSIGDERWLQGPRERAGWQPAYLERERFPGPLAQETLESHQATLVQAHRGALSLVSTGLEALTRPHETRAELDCGASDEAIEAALAALAEDRLVTDVILYSERDIIRSLYRVERIVERLRALPRVTAVRLRSPALAYRPRLFSDGVVKRLGSLNRLEAARPTRLEVETWFLHSSELQPEHPRLVRALRQRGITVYCNVPLLAFVNDGLEELGSLSAALRRAGFEFHHCYLGGLPVQREWSAEHPIHVSQVIDLASHLRRSGSGRELPRYMIRTPLGEVAFGLSGEHVGTDEQGRALICLSAYTLADYRRIDPAYSFPVGVQIDDAGHPVVVVDGLMG